MAKINETLRQLRLDRGMTQEQVAELVGLTRQAVSSYEAGRTQPGVDILERLADVYEVELTDIIYGRSKALRLHKALKISATAMAAVVLASQLLASLLMWTANRFFALAPGSMSDADALVWATRAKLMDAWTATDTFYYTLFPLFCVAILVLTLCQHRPLPVKIKLLCAGGFVAASMAAVLPWALTDSFFPPINYLTTPHLCLVQLAFFLILSLGIDFFRTRKRSSTGSTEAPHERNNTTAVPVYKRWWFWALTAAAAAIAAMAAVTISVAAVPDKAEPEPVTNPAFSLNGVDYPQDATIQDFIDRGWRRGKAVEQQGNYAEGEGVTDLVDTGYRLTSGESSISAFLDKKNRQSGIKPNECIIDRLSFYSKNIMSFTLGGVELTTIQKGQVIDLLGEPDSADDLNYFYRSRPEEGVASLLLCFSSSSDTVVQIIVCLGESIFEQT